MRASPAQPRRRSREPLASASSLLLPDSARNRLTGIAIASAAYLCFAVLDTSAKWLVQSLPVFEVVWLRFVGHLVFMALAMSRTGLPSLKSVRRPGLQVVRSMMLLSMTGLNFWALQYLQLAETSAVLFSMPILLAPLSVWLLRERLDAGRWIAVAGGFAGVLLIMRPGTQGFHPAIFLSVGNALVYAFFSLLTRKLAATDPPEITNVLTAVGAALLIAPAGLSHWQTPATLTQWLVIALTGLAGGTGHLMLAQAHRFAPASTLAPFLYQMIVYMALGGWLVFGDVPGGAVVAGTAVIVCCGLYLLWREGKTQTPQAPLRDNLPHAAQCRPTRQRNSPP